MEDLLKQLVSNIDEHGGVKHINSCVIAMDFDNDDKDGNDVIVAIEGDMIDVLSHITKLIVQVSSEKNIPIEKTLEIISDCINDVVLNDRKEMKR